MKNLLEINTTSRNMIIKILENHSLEQLNTIPEGFSNNLIWNIAHVVVTQQLLVYKLSGLPLLIDNEMVERYKKGTTPTQPTTLEEVAIIKTLLHSTIEQTKKDFEKDIFTSYSEYPTSTGYVLNNVQDAIAFNNFHEGVHIGVLLALKKLV